MHCGNEEHSGIMIKISRCAGTCVGTAAAAGKKITRAVTSGATAAGHLLTWPIHTTELIASEQTEPISKGSDMEERERLTKQEESAKSLISALESDIAEARGQLKEAQSKAEKTQSQIELQLNKLQSEREALRADLARARSQAYKATLQTSEVKTQVDTLEMVETGHIAVEKRGFSTGTAVAELAEDVSLKIEEQPFQVLSDIEMPVSPAVTDEQLQAAFFSKMTDKILFVKAISDMENEDVVVRLDAVKKITEIGHDLSVKALAAQTASEPSPQIRQECIKGLTTLGSKEGLPAIENALADESALVRLTAVWGLYRVAGKQSGTKLAGMLSDKDEQVRRRAATCLGWLGQGKFAADLTILLDDDSVSVRQSAAEAMGKLGNERVVMSLVKHLKEPDRATRKTILHSIEKITGKKMGKSLPKNEEDINHLIARWRQWWKENMLE